MSGLLWMKDKDKVIWRQEASLRTGGFDPQISPSGGAPVYYNVTWDSTSILLALKRIDLKPVQS